MTVPTTDRTTAASPAATLRLGGIFVGAAGLLEVALWFLPGGGAAAPLLAGAGVFLSAGLLAAAASVVARGADSKGGLVGATGATALILFAVLLVLRPLVTWFSPSTTGSTPTEEMVVAWAAVLAMGGLAVIAGVVGLVALGRSRSVPRRVVVVAAVALGVNAVADVTTSIPLLFTATPSQELLIGVWTVSSIAGSLLIVATGVIWLLASRSLARPAAS